MFHHQRTLSTVTSNGNYPHRQRSVVRGVISQSTKIDKKTINKIDKETINIDLGMTYTNPTTATLKVLAQNQFHFYHRPPPDINSYKATSPKSPTLDWLQKISCMWPYKQLLPSSNKDRLKRQLPHYNMPLLRFNSTTEEIQVPQSSAAKQI